MLGIEYDDLVSPRDSLTDVVVQSFPGDKLFAVSENGDTVRAQPLIDLVYLLTVRPCIAQERCRFLVFIAL